MVAGDAGAQLTTNPTNEHPNPYRTISGWGKLPEGRTWGSTSAIYPTRDGRHIWVAERCGANVCVGSDADPVLLFDLDGNLIRSFGAGSTTASLTWRGKSGSSS